MTQELQLQLFDKWVARQREVLVSKGTDYAGDVDRLKNFKVAGAAAGNSAEINCLNLIATKVARLGQLLNSKQTPKNESVDDSTLDLSNYSFLLHCIKEEEKLSEKVDYKDLPF